MVGYIPTFFKSFMEIKKIISILNVIKKSGYKGYLVGGSARDFVYGREFVDVDIATNMPLETIRKSFDVIDDSGKPFGSLKIKFANMEAQLTHFRKEIYEKDETFPKTKLVDNIEDDANRRDFTINAIYLDISNKMEAYDPYDGIHDLYNHILRFIGDPKIRIHEDPTRIIRGLRIAYKLNLDIDNDTNKAFIENINELERLSKSRYEKEIKKMYQDLCVNKTKMILDNYKMEDIVYEHKEDI